MINMFEFAWSKIFQSDVLYDTLVYRKDSPTLITRLAAGWSVLANQRCRRDFACCSSLQSGVHPNGRIPAGLGIYCPSVPDYHLAER
ncbi:hypothetical protein ALC53_06119 [Atta colombica]|uniref:Uncharacterized protein n=1 Tax=Atta colombica TaxID=520822 RepID=A0A195BGW0_9HYME|nr:hypothetical protein ALC53_06119 [Atta colombica]